MLTSLALFLLLGNQDPLDKQISFSHPPARLEVLLPQLSKVAGLPLEFDSTTVNEIVVIHLKDASIRDMLANLAEVCSATWVLKEGRRIVTRPTALDQKEAAEEATLLIKQIVEQLKFVAGDGPIRPPLTRATATA